MDRNRIEESTETIERGMKNPFAYILIIGGIVGIPFTAGLSLLGVVLGLLMMTGGGRAYVQAIPPTAADAAYPAAGCARMAAALGSLVVLVLIVGLLLAAIAYSAGVQP